MSKPATILCPLMLTLVACSAASKRDDSTGSHVFPSKILHCPPEAPQPERSKKDIDGNGKNDWLLDRTDDGHRHDVEIWCIDSTPATDFHFAVELSHPDGTSSWFALCVFDRGQNELRLGKESPWQDTRWDNIDPKPKQDHKTFNDVHYEYQWSSNALKVQLTQDGGAVGRPIIVPAAALTDEQAFEKAVAELIGEASGEPIQNGSGCEVTPR